MKATITIKKEVDVRYMKVDAGVRYWEDASVNGQKDVDMCECKGNATPMIPFAVKVKEQPATNIYSDHYRWQPTIDVENGCIVDWPKGMTAHIHYKVCDDGTYTLLDNEKNVIFSVDSYVPDCIGEFGDYIVMDVDEDGNIEDFNFTADDVVEIHEGGF